MPLMERLVAACLRVNPAPLPQFFSLSHHAAPSALGAAAARLSSSSAAAADERSDEPSSSTPPSSSTTPFSRSLPRRLGPIMTKRQFLRGGDDVLRAHAEAASYQGSIEQHAGTIRALRAHNYSLPALKGQVVLARVLRVTSQHVHVDPGFHSITDVPRKHLDLSHVRKVAPGQPLSSRTSSSDLRVGDTVVVQVDAIYTPYGDMQVEALQQDPQLRRRALWQELEAAQRAQQPVLGRVLNQCPGGYAVGVSGFVALLPYAQASTATVMRVGELAPFFIDRASEQQQLLVLRDGRLPRPRGARA